MALVRIVVALVAFFTVTLCSADYTTNEECSRDDDINECDVSSNMNFFLDWAKENGAKFPKFVVNDSKDDLIRGRTIQANEAIKAGEEVLFIPENMMLSYWRGKRTRLGRLLSKEAVNRGLSTDVKGLEQQLVVTAFLLHESKDPTSYWKPYIDTLPKLGHLPYNFMKLSRNELRNTWALHLIEKIYKHAHDTWEIYSQFGQYSWDEYLQAYLHVRTKAYPDKKIGLKMVPIADLLNHWHPHNVDVFYDSERNGLFAKSRTDILRNEEVTTDHGYPSKIAKLFANFDPEYSGAQIYLSLVHYYPDYERKRKIIPRMEDSYVRNLAAEYIIDLPENYGQWMTKIVFSKLRMFTQPIHVSSDNELQFALTVESEQIMLKEFIRILEAASDRMKSSISNDEALLKKLKGQGEKADSRMIQLIRIRLEERNVLLSWKTLANECITILQTRTMLETTHSSDYINRVISPLVLGGSVNPH